MWQSIGKPIIKEKNIAIPNTIIYDSRLNSFTFSGILLDKNGYIQSMLGAVCPLLLGGSNLKLLTAPVE